MRLIEDVDGAVDVTMMLVTVQSHPVQDQHIPLKPSCSNSPETLDFAEAVVEEALVVEFPQVPNPD